jgi:hypothetical protein
MPLELKDLVAQLACARYMLIAKPPPAGLDMDAGNFCYFCERVVAEGSAHEAGCKSGISDWAKRCYVSRGTSTDPAEFEVNAGKIHTIVLRLEEQLLPAVAGNEKLLAIIEDAVKHGSVAILLAILLFTDALLHIHAPDAPPELVQIQQLDLSHGIWLSLCCILGRGTISIREGISSVRRKKPKQRGEDDYAEYDAAAENEDNEDEDIDVDNPEAANLAEAMLEAAEFDNLNERMAEAAANLADPAPADAPAAPNPADQADAPAQPEPVAPTAPGNAAADEDKESAEDMERRNLGILVLKELLCRLFKDNFAPYVEFCNFEPEKAIPETLRQPVEILQKAWERNIASNLVRDLAKVVKLYVARECPEITGETVGKTVAMVKSFLMFPGTRLEDLNVSAFSNGRPPPSNLIVPVPVEAICGGGDDYLANGASRIVDDYVRTAIVPERFEDWEETAGDCLLEDGQTIRGHHAELLENLPLRKKALEWDIPWLKAQRDAMVDQILALNEEIAAEDESAAMTMDAIRRGQSVRPCLTILEARCTLIEKLLPAQLRNRPTTKKVSRMPQVVALEEATVAKLQVLIKELQEKVFHSIIALGEICDARPPGQRAPYPGPAWTIWTWNMRLAAIEEQEMRAAQNGGKLPDGETKLVPLKSTFTPKDSETDDEALQRKLWLDTHGEEDFLSLPDDDDGKIEAIELRKVSLKTYHRIEWRWLAGLAFIFARIEGTSAKHFAWNKKADANAVHKPPHMEMYSDKDVRDTIPIAGKEKTVHRVQEIRPLESKPPEFAVGPWILLKRFEEQLISQVRLRNRVRRAAEAAGTDPPPIPPYQPIDFSIIPPLPEPFVFVRKNSDVPFSAKRPVSYYVASHKADIVNGKLVPRPGEQARRERYKEKGSTLEKVVSWPPAGSGPPPVRATGTDGGLDADGNGNGNRTGNGNGDGDGDVEMLEAPVDGPAERRRLAEEKAKYKAEKTFPVGHATMSARLTARYICFDSFGLWVAYDR